MLFLGIVSKNEALSEAVLEQIRHSTPWQATLFPSLDEALPVWRKAAPPLVFLDSDSCTTEQDVLGSLRALPDKPWVMVLGSLPDVGDDAPDCFDRPLRLGRLLSRLQFYKSLLERPPETVLSFGPFSFYPRQRRITSGNGDDVSLTDKETELLEYLVAAERLVSKNELLEEVWGYDSAKMDTHTLETHIYRLRRKMAAGAEDCFVTENGGYGLNPSWRLA